MENAYIVDGIRTAIGNFGGTLATVRTDDLAAFVLKSLLKRNPTVNPQNIDDIIIGCANQAGEDNRNVARMAALLAGVPWSVPGETVNRLCASGMSSIIHAQRAINAGDGDLFISGGVENMTRGPWVISKVSKPYGRDAEMHDSSFGWRFINPKMEALYGTEGMGTTAENLVEKYSISREDQDIFAFQSQKKAAAASKNGRLQEEIAAIKVLRKKADPLIFSTDEFVKPATTLEVLNKLRPAFKKSGGSVTAGNSSGLNDGAAACLIASDQAINYCNLKPLCRIVSSAVVGVHPSFMGIGPVKATKSALIKAGLRLKQIGLIELNEAFAAQTLACIRELGMEDNDPRINVNGGAIALGHPLGMSGARITFTLALEMQKQNVKYGLATMCVGVGQGYAVILENVNCKL